MICSYNSRVLRSFRLFSISFQDMSLLSSCLELHFLLGTHFLLLDLRMTFAWKKEFGGLDEKLNFQNKNGNRKMNPKELSLFANFHKKY